MKCINQLEIIVIPGGKLLWAELPIRTTAVADITPRLFAKFDELFCDCLLSVLEPKTPALEGTNGRLALK